MAPKEYDHISVKVSPEIKKILVEESEKAGLSQTEYLERLIEGTLPDRMTANIMAIRDEILGEIKKIQKTKK